MLLVNQYARIPIGKKNPDTARLAGMPYSISFWIIACCGSSCVTERFMIMRWVRYVAATMQTISTSVTARVAVRLPCSWLTRAWLLIDATIGAPKSLAFAASIICWAVQEYFAAFPGAMYFSTWNSEMNTGAWSAIGRQPASML